MRRYAWTGWDTGHDITPEEPGKEWLTITTLDHEGNANGEEIAIIVLRTDASIFVDMPGGADLLEEARREREQNAQMIVDALNLRAGAH